MSSDDKATLLTAVLNVACVLLVFTVIGGWREPSVGSVLVGLTFGWMLAWVIAKMLAGRAGGG